MRRVLRRFAGLPHRARLVCTRGGVRYVDDSKATNPAAAARSLAAQSGPIIWIAGGRNKGLDFRPLALAARGVRVAILVGEAAAELDRALAGCVEVALAGTLEKAVAEAARRASAGDVVLLAPACTSFDQFRSFEERGLRFAELARALPGARAEGS
jgi:UDP-N-acetylmuramoylalanine--D-glutamate ligase